MSKPLDTEYIPAAKNYVALAPDGNLNDLLTANLEETLSFFRKLPTGKQNFRYAEDKWTLKEMVVHISDAERVFAYRSLTLARGDRNAVFPNMNENLFAENVDPSGRSFDDILQEFATVRASSQFLFNNLTSEQLRYKGLLFGYPVTPYGFGFILIGHAIHHMNIVRERYL